MSDPVLRPGAGAWIAAVLLPPLGAYLARGLAAEFWIATALTLLGFVPGALYALYLVAGEARASSTARPAAA